MSEKILKVVLSAIPTILLVICVVAGFATHGWDVQAALFSEDPQEIVERLLPSEIGAEEGFIEVTGFKPSEDGTFTIEAVLRSPLNVPVKIKELSAELILYGSPVTISLPGEVEIPAKGSASLKLEGALPAVPAQTQMPPTLPSAEQSTPTNIRNVRMKLDISGIELEMEESGLGGN
ncbi:MAG: hypothetical protein H8D26_01955 [Methanomicrobia archaeon]|nr:hypothetical protein [Methanomicrobia archaeon]